MVFSFEEKQLNMCDLAVSISKRNTFFRIGKQNNRKTLPADADIHRQFNIPG